MVTGSNTAGVLTLSTTGNMDSTVGTTITALSANLLAGGTIGGYYPGDPIKTTVGGVNYDSFGSLNVPTGTITVRAGGIDFNSVSVDINGTSVNGVLTLTPPNVPTGAVLFNGLSVTSSPFVKGVTPLAGPAALATVLSANLTGNGDAMSPTPISMAELFTSQAFPTAAVRNQITVGTTTVGILAPIITLQGIGVSVSPDVAPAFQRQDELERKR